jgi:hypothetical protein
MDFFCVSCRRKVEKCENDPQNKTNTMKQLGIAFGILLLLSSCGEEVKKKYTISGAALVAEGPLFDGPNTLQGAHVIDLSSIDPQLTAEKIASVRLVNANIQTTDSIGFDRIRNMVFQLTSANASMQNIASVNPVPKGVKAVALSPANEQEITELFKQSDLVLILDADLEGDLDGNLEYSGDFEFEISYKQ